MDRQLSMEDIIKLAAIDGPQSDGIWGLDQQQNSIIGDAGTNLLSEGADFLRFSDHDYENK